MFFGKGIKTHWILWVTLALAKLMCISKEWLDNTYPSCIQHTQGHSEPKQELFYACMYVHAGITKGEGVHDTLTLNATVMSLHTLLASHPHPSVTHGEQIRWTASITWHYTLLLQAFFQGNKIWSTSFHSTVCMCECFCQFGRRCFSTECSCGHSRDCTSVPEGCTKVRAVTREKWRWVPKLLLWANPHFNLPPGITNLTYTQTQR